MRTKFPARSQISLLAIPLLASTLLAGGCIDARSAANSTAGFISRTADSEPARSPRRSREVESVSIPSNEVIIADVDSGGPVSAFGMGWMAAPSANGPFVVYDSPGIDREPVGELQPFDNNFWVAERVRVTNAAKWRRVTLADGTVGWIEAQHLVAQPTRLTFEDTKTLRALARNAELTPMSPLVADEASQTMVQVQVKSESSDYFLLFDWSNRKIRLAAILRFEIPGSS